MENKSEQFNDSYNERLFDFEAAHQALLKEVRNKAYAEGYEAGREYERNLPFANRQNPFKLGSRSEVEKPVKLEKESNEGLENKKKHKGMDEESYNRLLQEHHKEMKEDEEQYRNLQEYYKENTAKNKQQAERDEIIEQAKADLARLTNHGYCYAYERNLKVEFIVDNKKRTVEAILRRVADAQIVTTGLARCAPNDCFNVYIGQVIALLRAMNVEVPDKYLNTPQPTEVRKGDVIEVTLDNGDVEIKPVIETRCHGRINVSLPGRGIEFPSHYARIVDDSREEAEGESYEEDLRKLAKYAFAVGETTSNITRDSEASEAFDVAEGVVESFTVGDQQAKEYVESAIKETREFNQQARRDEIVEQAKKNVDIFLKRGTDDYPSFMFEAEFIVNKEKRTVVALIKGRNSRHVYTRGIAKCAPGDCFNVHIGMEIALRRALGLPVPDEYLNAPQPTEVRVGDVVCGNGGDDHYYSKNKTFTITKDSVERIDGGFLYKENTDDWIERDQIGRIIDDSRE
ncbi:hypothetical protein P8825_15340 [Shouchella clausii]|uniref:hypothetical protein n=1 Tax=Shouchella clausii TaxID=79880 RepID=UPI002DB6B165|nr:hypothetical protein [Shouchella clausii]MEB5480939.1 hypothetical protein [Shouchella clausii]